MILSITCAGCGATSEPPLTIVPENPADLPLRGLSAELRSTFNRGDASFDVQFRETQGLGPVYIRAACASCHEGDAKGPGLVTKMVVVDTDGFTPSTDQSSLLYGHTVRPQAATGAMPIVAPEGQSLKMSKRIGPAVFGRGYIEAVADSEIERLEAEQAARDDAISGRINRVTRTSRTNDETKYHQHQEGQSGLIGRFGLKARIATVDDFTADAYQGDMGITSPLRENELPNPASLADDAHEGRDIELATVNDVADYVRMLEIPRAHTETPLPGAALFDTALCSVCHAPSLHTRSDYPIDQLRDIDAPVYSDLLLHDMGDELSDGLDEQSATWREWRTAPLIGIQFLRNYLHDGRARTVEDAVLAHEGRGSEANGSVEKFKALSHEEQAALIAFVEAL